MIIDIFMHFLSLKIKKQKFLQSVCKFFTMLIAVVFFSLFNELDSIAENAQPLNNEPNERNEKKKGEGEPGGISQILRDRSDDKYIEYLIARNKGIVKVKESSKSKDFGYIPLEAKERVKGENIKQREDIRRITPIVETLITTKGRGDDLTERIIDNHDSESEILGKTPKGQMKSKKKDREKLDKLSSGGKDTSASLVRKNKSYYAIGISALIYGSNSIYGSERPTLDDPEVISTFKGNVDYTSFLDASLRLGRVFPALAGVSHPLFYRIEIGLSYNRLITKLKNIGPRDDYGEVIQRNDNIIQNYPDDPVFTVPTNYGNAHLVTFGVNGFLDLFKLGPGYPYIGAGVGMGVMIFDNYLNASFFAPLFDFHAGYIMHVSKKFEISIAYKLTLIFPTTYTSTYVVPINGGDDRPVVDNYVNFQTGLIHKLEVTFYIF